MNTLRQAVDDYLALRQAMGFKLYEESRLLPRYIDFLEDQGEVFITTDLAVRWATECRAAQPAEWARRPALPSPPSGPGDCGSCVFSPATVARPIRARKFRPPGCCPTMHGVQNPTFTTTMKSSGCSRLPANCTHPRDCVPTLT